MIGDNLKRIRESKNIGVNELSRMSGINASYISALERNKKTNPSMDILQKLADTLDVDFADIVVSPENSFSLELLCALQDAYHNNSHDGVTDELKFWEFISEKLSIDYNELSILASDKTAEYSIGTQLKLIDDFKEIDHERFLDFAKYNKIPVKSDYSIKNNTNHVESVMEKTLTYGNKKNDTKKSTLSDMVPEEFTNPEEARSYINKHKIFASEGFDVKRLSDDDVLEFANALLEQMKMVSYKYKK